ncbi:MAG: BatA domain-containing protein, partial [Candidatus Eisenbacteria bacterium]
MNFLNPLFLFGLGAAALPVLIHLFTRRKPREVKFPSLDFLSEVNQSEIRRLRLKQWLLLALRTLAVACMALAMARPSLQGGKRARGGDAASTLVALVDVSGSMGAPDGEGRPLTATARRVVESLLATLGPADEMLLVPYDRTTRPLSDAPIAESGRLRAAATALAPSSSATDHAAALELAARALQASHALNRELFWVSDFQRTGFGERGFALPPGPWDAARVYLVPLEPRSRANAALTNAGLAPAADPGAPPALEVDAQSFDAVSGTSAQDFALEARELTPGGAASDPSGNSSLGRGFVSLAARGEGRALVPLSRLPAAGGEVLLPDDALGLDNRRVFAAGRAGLLRVLLREDGPPSPLRFALEAGSPASGLTVRALDGSQLAAGTGDADLVVIGDIERLGPTDLQAVLDFHRAGGGLLLVPGARADVAAWNDLFRQLGLGTFGPEDAASAGATWRLLRAVAGHAVLDGFPTRPGEPLTQARFTRVHGLRAAAGARVLLRFDDAHVALVEAPRALALNTPLDPTRSDFALSGAFLPLVHQAALVLGRGTAAPSLTPGDRWSAPASAEWRVEDETGREVPVSIESSGGATRAMSAPLERTGLYRAYAGATLRASFAVNPAASEGDLTPINTTSMIAAFPAGRARVLHAGEDMAQRI